ncbi:hypothetical protein [Novosphingobium aquimarinum]|uniref:hypothetical protein n=1 Tax=Novosphingobium aquimarinum TaxID=2682494 RepID=UPI0012EC550C|nr:hypothetical protein [Novosphingobium aquimarinum]
MPFDWLNATPDDRKALYRSVRQAMDAANLNWSQVFDQAFDGEQVGSGLEDTFRAGRIGRKKAKRIAEWLARDHPKEAAQLDALLKAPSVPVSAGALWKKWLEEHGHYDGIGVVRLSDPAAGIVTFANPEPLAGPIIPLGAPFCFQLHSDLAGASLAFQSVKGLWYPLPLSENEFSSRVDEGVQYVPSESESGQPVALSEDVHAGRHRFALLVGEAQLVDVVAGMIDVSEVIDPAVLDAIAKYVSGAQSPWRLHRINLLFQAGAA